MASTVLDRLLITLAVRLHAFALCEIKDGWRLRFDPMEAVVIHYVLAGSGTLKVGGSAAVPFERHCMMIVPPRCGQSLETGAVIAETDAADSCEMVGDGLLTFTAGDGSRDLLVVCGTISATYAGALGLFDGLQGPLVQGLSADDGIRHAFEMLLAEMTRPGIGAQALTEALMKQCLVLLLRRHLLEAGARSPIFAALQDERLARCVAAVVERPAAGHTVESLASLAGMSRSSFAESFSRTFGESPIEFVQNVRLRLAAQLLGATDLPVKVIASSVGYASRSYFSRAFRAAYGADPSTFRATGGTVEVEPTAVEGQGEAVFPEASGPDRSA